MQNDLLKNCKMSSKTCTRCKLAKSLESFYVDNRRPGGRHSICIVCRRKHQLNRSKNPEYIRRKKKYYLDNRVRICAERYGITEVQVRILHAKKHCQLCGKKFKSGPRSRYIDHCHETGKVRGVLCSSCNYALGILGDRVASLQKAINYVSGEIP